MKAYYKILSLQDLENWQGKTIAVESIEKEELFSRLSLE